MAISCTRKRHHPLRHSSRANSSNACTSFFASADNDLQSWRVTQLALLYMKHLYAAGYSASVVARNYSTACSASTLVCIKPYCVVRRLPVFLKEGAPSSRHPVRHLLATVPLFPSQPEQFTLACCGQVLYRQGVRRQLFAALHGSSDACGLVDGRIGVMCLRAGMKANRNMMPVISRIHCRE